MDKKYTITDISQKTGLSLDTIRYYEKTGILPPAEREYNGQRTYTESDLNRFIFVTNLKRTRMSLNNIKTYIECYMKDDYETCYDILDRHKEQIEMDLIELNVTLKTINYKLDNYKDLI